MIGKIKGKLAEYENNYGLIETTSGVFYKVFLSLEFLSPEYISQEIEVYTYLQIKEDDHVLYGFKDKATLKLFELLIKVDGVGPKMAFNIISSTIADNIIEAVTSNNLDFFCSIPGVGRKTAQKILIELSSKMGKMVDVLPTILTQDERLVVDALFSLGFKKSEGEKIISKLDKNISVEEKVKEAIKLLTKK